MKLGNFLILKKCSRNLEINNNGCETILFTKPLGTNFLEFLGVRCSILFSNCVGGFKLSAFPSLEHYNCYTSYMYILAFYYHYGLGVAFDY
jgi:hypothetical protein